MAAGKKKKGSQKAKPELSATGEPASIVIKRFMKAYEESCVATGSLVSSYIKSACKKCIEDERFLTKVILENVAPLIASTEPHVLIVPLGVAMRDSRYTYVKELYVWGIIMDSEQMVTLALLFERRSYPIRSLELLDCLIEPRGLSRLCRAIDPTSTLTSLTLDYNEFGDEGCEGLCIGLFQNMTLLKLSLCYCVLTPKSGRLLGRLITSSALRELFLDGNDLGCEGAQALIAACAEYAEREMSQLLQKKALKAYEKQQTDADSKKERSTLSLAASAQSIQPAQASPTKKKSKKKGGKRKPKSSELPAIGPWLFKLHIADNGIDASDEHGGDVAPLICMRLMRRFIANSATLQELDLEDNLIGDLGGRELIGALKDRAEVNDLPSIRLRTTHRMQAETFKDLCKLGGGSIKKKKRKGKKEKF